MKKQFAIAESLLANSAYFSLLLFAMSRGIQSGVVGLAVVASVCKATTVVMAGLLATSPLGLRRVWAVLLVSQALTLALVACYFLTPLGDGAWWSLLPLMAMTSTLQVFENNLRSKLVGNASPSGASVSPKTYIRITQGALVLASFAYLMLTHVFFDLPSWSIQASIAAWLFLSLALKLPVLAGERRLIVVPSLDKVSFAAGFRAYIDNPHVGRDLCLAICFMGSNTFTVYVLGLHGGSAAIAVLLSGISIWLSPALTGRRQITVLLAFAMVLTALCPVVMEATWGLRALWVLVFNITYWTAFGGITSNMYAVVRSERSVEFTAFRNAIVVTLASAGELLCGLLLQHFGIAVLIATRFALCIAMILVSNNWARAESAVRT